MDELFVQQFEEANAYLDDNRSISEKKCVEMYGSNGYPVYKKLEELGVGRKYGYGDLQRTPKASELRKSNYFKDLIKEVRQKEYDAELDRESKRVSIRYTKRAYAISIIALILSTASIVLQFL